MPSFVSLFAGIGGVDLGFHRAGFDCIAQVEQNPFALRVLKKHWPDVERFDDVCDYDLPETGCDVLCGGFPCQDISNAANNRQGLRGERSGLWRQMFRIAKRGKPPFIFIENVSALRRMGLGIVLRDLSSIGYDAEWQTLRASQFGYPHKRSRLFIVAYAHGIEWRSRSDNEAGVCLDSRWKPNAEAIQCQSGWELQRWLVKTYETLGFPATDPATSGRIDGIPNRLDRLRGCGNAVVPAIAEFIANRIKQSSYFTHTLG